MTSAVGRKESMRGNRSGSNRSKGFDMLIIDSSQVWTLEKDYARDPEIGTSL